MITVSDARIVTEKVNPAVFNVFGEKKLWPKNAIFGPGALSRSTEIMHEDNTETMQWLIGVAEATYVYGVVAYSTLAFSPLWTSRRPYDAITMK